MTNKILSNCLILLSFGVLMTEQSCKSVNEKYNVSDTETTDVDSAVTNQIKSLKVEDLAKFMNNDSSALLLDVRTFDEIKEGKIGNPLVLDYYSDEFEQNIFKLPKDKTYIVYCKSGKRSDRAAKVMQRASIKDVYNLEGGYEAYSDFNN